MDFEIPRRPDEERNIAPAAGTAASTARTDLTDTGTNRLLRFRLRHPFPYGLIAFLLGGACVGVVTMSSYGNWAFEGINLKAAFWQVVFGSLGGAVVLTILAFAYTEAIRSLEPATGRRPAGARV